MPISKFFKSVKTNRDPFEEARDVHTGDIVADVHEPHKKIVSDTQSSHEESSKSKKKKKNTTKTNLLERKLAGPVRKLNIRNKMVAIALPPILIVAILATFNISERVSLRNESQNTVSLLAFTDVNGNLANALRREMIYSAAYLGSAGQDWEQQMLEARGDTDTQLEIFEALNQQETLDNIAPLTASLVERLESRLQNLSTDRTAILSQQLPTLQAIEQYSSTLQVSNQITFSAAQEVQSPELIGKMNNLSVLNRLENSVAQEASIVVVAIENEGFFSRSGATCESVFSIECTSFVSAQTQRAEVDASLANFIEVAVVADDRIAVRDTGAVGDYEIITQEIYNLARAGEDLTAFTSVTGEENESDSVSSFMDATIAQLGVYADISQETLNAGVKIANQNLSDATRTAILFVLLTILIVAIALALVFTVAKLTAKPLIDLTEAAQVISEEKLPELVESLKSPTNNPLKTQAEMGESTASKELVALATSSRDEVGKLAQAFTSIQDVTLNVAEAQSELLKKGISDIFVNLARRNQILLDKQLKAIEEMEQNEQDAETLANLFALDHLATRMQRNAESLLVLAGAEAVRTRPGAPIIISDVVRMGMGEVEGYQRVKIVKMDKVYVPTNVARDLAHVLSELIENATQFSPPDKNIEIAGHATRDGSYLLKVVDSGIGMSEDHLNSANYLLSNPPLMGLNISRSLGFIVVGRLAARFNMYVSLAPNPDGGTVATVSLPPNLLTEPSSPSTGVDEAAISRPPMGVPARPPQPVMPPTPPAPPAPPVIPPVAPVAPQPQLPPPPPPQPVAPPTPPTPPVIPPVAPVAPQPQGLAVRKPKTTPQNTEYPAAPHQEKLIPVTPPQQPVPQRDIQDMLSRFRTGTQQAQDSTPPRKPAANIAPETLRNLPPPVQTAKPEQGDGMNRDATPDTSTQSGTLTKRQPKGVGQKRSEPGVRATTSNMTPEQVRQSLMRYRSGIKKT